jgi:gluconate 2-dehydrogenase gamma chain
LDPRHWIGGESYYAAENSHIRRLHPSAIVTTVRREISITLNQLVAASRIFPSDENGPGAREAGVAVFIDRQLAGPWGRDRFRYTQEPFEEDASSEFGYQGKATPQQVYRQGLNELKGFELLGPAAQDAKLKQIEGTLFFSLLRQNTVEGMFCDPMHGGNKDMIGWQLIGFPGPRMNNYDDIEKHYGEAFRPKPASLREIAGSSIRLSEDEK